MQRTAKLAFLRLWPNSQQIYRSFKLRRVEQLSATSLTMSDEGEAAKLLEAGWGRAARWNTTAGKWLAYSSLTVGGVHFPGWRPWFLRWTWIREALTFEGRTGSTSAAASGSSVASRSSKERVGGRSRRRRLIPRGRAADRYRLRSPPRFEQLKLGSSDGWQARLPSADIAVAMSIGEWVDDKKAFFTFLSRFPELIYEGHDSLRIEHDRFGRRLRPSRSWGSRSRPSALRRHAMARRIERRLRSCGLPGALRRQQDDAERSSFIDFCPRGRGRRPGSERGARRRA